MKTRVLLVDDHPAVLRQVSPLLLGEFEVGATLDGGDAVPAAVKQHRPDLIVLDVTLRNVSGIELASRLQPLGNPARIVFLTVHDDPDYARAAFEAGAAGYVIKARLATDLIPALRAALEGRRFVSPSGGLKDFDA